MSTSDDAQGVVLVAILGAGANIRCIPPICAGPARSCMSEDRRDCERSQMKCSTATSMAASSCARVTTCASATGVKRPRTPPPPAAVPSGSTANPAPPPAPQHQAVIAAAADQPARRTSCTRNMDDTTDNVARIASNRVPLRHCGAQALESQITLASSSAGTSGGALSKSPRLPVSR